MAIPNYFVIGAAKAASSSLCTSLGEHPDVFMVECKEPEFFAKDAIYSRGLDWYQSLYAGAGSKRLRGEGSNMYSAKECFPQTVERIRRHAGDAKLIYIVRHPLRRIESLWLQLRSHSGEDVHHDFNVALRVNREILVDSSNYLAQIDAYRRYWSDDQILILFFEDFREDPKQVLRRCFEFLGVDPDYEAPDEITHLNPSDGKPLVRAAFSKLRLNPICSSAKHIIPRRIRESIYTLPWFERVKYERPHGRPAFTPETRYWVLDQLQEPTLEFLDRYGKPRDFWSCTEPMRLPEFCI